MSLPEIKKMLEEILQILKSKQESPPQDNSLEMVAAKIIKEIKDEISKCPCNQEILDAIGNKSPSEQPLVSPDKGKNIPSPTSGLSKYTWPNFMVGNGELGSSEDPDALVWPTMKPKYPK